MDQYINYLEHILAFSRETLTAWKYQNKKFNMKDTPRAEIEVSDRTHTSHSGADPELNFGGHYRLFYARSFITQLFAIGDATYMGEHCPLPPLDPPLPALDRNASGMPTSI